MSATICPTVLAENQDDFRTQMERLIPFAERIHIDVADGELAPTKTVELSELWWPGNVAVDLHVMYKRPFEHMDSFVIMHPQVVIVHAEAEGDFDEFAARMHRHGIQTGVALLPGTKTKLLTSAIDLIDHVLIFSGDLGHFGGQVDPDLFKKIAELRELKPSLEIGWDGGVNDQNAQSLLDAGVDVLDVGGYIQQASNPEVAYATLKSITVKS